MKYLYGFVILLVTLKLCNLIQISWLHAILPGLLPVLSLIGLLLASAVFLVCVILLSVFMKLNDGGKGK